MSVGSSSRSSGEVSGFDYQEYDEKDLPELQSSTNQPSWARQLKPRIRLVRYSRFSLSPRYARFWSIFCNLVRLLLPSFVPFSSSYQASSIRELHPTAWLDGVRGVAALCVVFHHFSHAWFSDRAFAGYGSGGDNLNTYIMQLPIVRLMISGYPHVAIFFVVSGYSISYKPMKLLHGGRSNEFLDSLSMSVFRRHMRLFLPATCVMFGSAIMTYMNWFGKGGGSREPPHADNLFGQIYNWAEESINLAEPFSHRDSINRYQPPYDMNLWTLPIEFRDSVILYAVMLGLCKTRSNIRLIITIALVIYSSYQTHWDIFLFLSGMLLADLHFRRNEPQNEILSARCDCNCGHTHPNHSSPITEIAQKLITHRLFWVFNYLLALWILSMPEVGRGSGTSPGFETLTKYIPNAYMIGQRPDYFWVPVAAVFLIFVVDHETSLQSIFESRIAQYLGKISFSLYMVHGPLLYSLGWHIQARAIAYWGQENDRQYGRAVVSTMAVVFPIIFWTSDVVWRLVDSKAVKFAKWVGDQVV
ncbi:acyltransferase family-domain-containing protein [Bisporella sp. PMI_857]|nr:acyltransferase family-domain-containing protein [Bisporella sp. PMI_857]